MMEPAKRAHNVETLKQTSCFLRLRAPLFYPDPKETMQHLAREDGLGLQENLLPNS
jgi:hypothetical protein